jgi:hypothetical protein
MNATSYEWVSSAVAEGMDAGYGVVVSWREKKEL